EDSRQREAREVAAVDEDLAEQAPSAALLVEALFELVEGQQLLVDEQRAELAPRKCDRSLHGRLIGRRGLVTQALSAGDHAERPFEDAQVVAEEGPAPERAETLDGGQV